MYRASSEGAAAAEVYRRAWVAFEALTQRQPRLAQANLDLLRRRERPLTASVYMPPEAPPAEAPGKSLADYIRHIEGVIGYYVAETARLDAELARLAQAHAATTRAPTLLGPPPRSVPITYLLAELFRGFWLAFRFVLFPPITIAALIPLVLLDGAPTTRPFLALPLAAVAIYALVRFARRARLLARGEVPTILARSLQLTNVRSSSVPRLVANGWQVAMKSFSGTSMHTELTYQTSAGVTSRASVYGPEFHGVLLCLPDRVGAVLPNTAFACTPAPDERGQWNPGAVSARVWITNTMGVLLAVSYALIVAARIFGQ